MLYPTSTSAAVSAPTGSTETQIEKGGEQKVCRNARGLWGGRAGCSALLCVGCLLLRAVWLQCCWSDCSEGTVGGTLVAFADNEMWVEERHCQSTWKGLLGEATIVQASLSLAYLSQTACL